MTRGNVSESVHFVDALVIDDKGEIVTSFGDAESCLTFPRSSIKMMQALSFVESGAFHQWALDAKYLSLACSSHSGQDLHTELVMDWLRKMDHQENDLVCGAHDPYHDETSRSLIRREQRPTRRHNNCSGKHTSMLCTLKTLKISHQDYHQYDHDLQVRLRRVLTELTCENMDQADWGVDGCGIPTYATSLKGIANGLRAFLPEQKNLSLDRKEATTLIRKAVLAEPVYIGGQGDFCSDVMALAQGRILVKSGAEGVFAGCLPEMGLSFALKVRDGQARAAKVATAELLRQLNALSDESFLQLSRHTQPDVKNWEGLKVGKIFVPPAAILS